MEFQPQSFGRLPDDIKYSDSKSTNKSILQILVTVSLKAGARRIACALVPSYGLNVDRIQNAGSDAGRNVASIGWIKKGISTNSGIY